MLVMKRDGSYEGFDSSKIRRAILMAADSVDEIIDAKSVTDDIVDELVGVSSMSIDALTKKVETHLCSVNPVVGRAYIEYRKERDLLRKHRSKPKNHWISEYIDITKYSRVKDDGYREVWDEAVDRVRDMHLSYYDNGISDLIHESFEYVRTKRVLPSMRSLQFGGEAILSNHNRMYNCRAICMDRVRAFGDLFYMLLCGCGVGYSVQWCHVDRLPPVTKISRDVMHWDIEDTIEGWADALNILMSSYMCPEAVEYGRYVEFNYSKIRPEGSQLHTTGGIAPGHLGLKKGIEQIREVLDRSRNRQLKPIEVSDINCYSALAVLSGGVRRSSLIGLFSPTDGEMLYAKYPGNFDPGGLNNHRKMANISCMIGENDYPVFRKCLELSETGYGEPGYYFSNDPNYLCNPCGEIGMDCSNGNIGDCNLTTINCHYWSDEVIKAAAVIGTLQAGYKNFKYIGRQFNSERDALLGVGLCGLCDVMIPCKSLRDGAALVRETNEKVASMIGIEPAARCTDIAPNGTSSLSLGCIGAGVHPQPGRRYIRRVTANRNEEALHKLMKVNPHMVIEKEDGDYCIEYPVMAKDNAILDIKGMKHLKVIQKAFDNWVLPGARSGSHNVSCTITVPEGESIMDLADAIWEKKCPKAATFCSDNLSAKYPYAPVEVVVTKAQEARYNELINNYKEVDWRYVKGSIDIGAACEGSKCYIK